MKTPINIIGTDEKTRSRLNLIYGLKEDKSKRKLYLVGNDPCWTDPYQMKETENSKWTLDPENGIKIFVDHLLIEGLNNEDDLKYGWAYESTAIILPFIEHIKENLEQYMNSYTKIFTHNEELASLHENIIHVYPGLPSWIEEPQIHKKNKLVSMITSSKSFCPGHRQRLHWANQLQGKLDLFGRGINPIIKKEEGLADYRFSICLENDDTDFYFSEKLLDCFMTGTIPVYWGSKKVTEYFDEEGIIWLEDDFNIDILTEELYNSKLESVKRNFETAKELNKGIPEMLDLFVENYIS